MHLYMYPVHRLTTFTIMIHHFSGGQLIGADFHYLGTCGYIMKRGRGFTDSDYEKYRKVAVIDSVAADSLFWRRQPGRKDN